MEIKTFLIIFHWEFQPRPKKFSHKSPDNFVHVLICYRTRPNGQRWRFTISRPPENFPLIERSRNTLVKFGASSQAGSRSRILTNLAIFKVPSPYSFNRKYLRFCLFPRNYYSIAWSVKFILFFSLNVTRDKLYQQGCSLYTPNR